MMSTIYHANISVMSTSCAQDTRPQPECHKLCSIPLSLKLISTLATSYIKMMTNMHSFRKGSSANGRVKRTVVAKNTNCLHYKPPYQTTDRHQEPLALPCCKQAFIVIMYARLN